MGWLDPISIITVEPIFSIRPKYRNNSANSGTDLKRSILINPTPYDSRDRVMIKAPIKLKILILPQIAVVKITIESELEVMP